MLGVVFAGAFAFEMYVAAAALSCRPATLPSWVVMLNENRFFDTRMNKIWDNHNRGVRILPYGETFWGVH